MQADQSPVGAGLRSPQFHVISFEGPDAYSRAGGIATRVNGLTRALADAGFDTHLWFVGDPERRGHETRGRLTLHRWCQWISRYHRAGVYDGEEGKRQDFAASLPPYLVREALLPVLQQTDERAVVLAEEWHTVDAVIHLDWLLRRAGVRDRVLIFWNANNEFGFHRVNWPALKQAARITTVSRYMRCRLWPYEVDPLVVPNGLSDEAFDPPDRAALTALRGSTRGRTLFAKVARWDPDKRWLLAVDVVRELKRQGRHPLLVARGGVEGHGVEVLAHAAEAGLHVRDVTRPIRSEEDLVHALGQNDPADILNVQSSVSGRAKPLLLRGAAAVLANSGREPFGLVGLETMAVGGLVCLD